MELVDTADTMALGGGGRCGVPLPGTTALDERRIYYYVLWPLAFISIHPDYLLVHRLVPQAAGRTTVICEWYFDPASVAAPDFDPSQAIAFWDLTNRQDWKVCELQQRGTASRSWRAAATRPRRPRSTPSTSCARTATRATERAPAGRCASATTRRRRRPAATARAPGTGTLPAPTGPRRRAGGPRRAARGRRPPATQAAPGRAAGPAGASSAREEAGQQVPAGLEDRIEQAARGRGVGNERIREDARNARRGARGRLSPRKKRGSRSRLASRIASSRPRPSRRRARAGWRGAPGRRSTGRR